MHISGRFIDHQKADIQNKKAYIQSENPDILEEKADIQKKLGDFKEKLSEKTVSHILALYTHCGKNEIFGRATVENVTGLKSTRASELLKLLLENQIIEKVYGNGKGRYRFL